MASFIQTRTVKDALINDVTKFARICHTFRPTCTKFGTQDVYKNLLINLEFRENGWNENHALLNCVDEFLSLLSTFIARFG